MGETYDPIVAYYQNLRNNNGANYTASTATWPSASPPYGTVSNPYPTPPSPQKEGMNTRIGTVQVKAGYLGQVYTVDGFSGAKVILWESSPKKTLAKADKAAHKAQLRAAQRSFE